MRICITITPREHKTIKQVAEIMGISQAAVMRVATTQYICNSDYLRKQLKKKK